VRQIDWLGDCGRLLVFTTLWRLWGYRWKRGRQRCLRPSSLADLRRKLRRSTYLKR